MRRSFAFSAVTLLGLFTVSFFAVTGHASEIGLEGIEARVGFVDLEGAAGSTFIVGAAADLGELAPDLGLEFAIDFWTKSWGESNVADWTWTNIGFLGLLRYDFPMEGSFKPFGFAGLGPHYWKSDWDCPLCDTIVGDLSTSGVEFGFTLGAGAEFGEGDGMTPVVRAGYDTNGGADYLYITGGLKFPVGD